MHFAEKTYEFCITRCRREKVGRTRLALKAESLNEFSKSKVHKLGKEMVADGI